MMKKILLIIHCLMASCVVLMAQQEEHFTQFMHFKLGYNPAYAGSNDAPALTLLSRNQWIGIEGAPQTQALSFNMPFANKKVGLGVNLLRQTIGIANNFSSDVVYAYRMRVARGYLAIGTQASVRLIRMDFSKVQGTQPIDTDSAVPVGMQSKWVPNFGAGLYYQTNNFFFGLSVPRLLQNNIDLADDEGVISREVRHFYLMAGAVIPLGEEVNLQPQMVFKYVNGAPFDADINVNVVFSNRLTTGVSYRLGGSGENSPGESASLILATQISDVAQFGLSYDLGLSALRNYNTGTIEAFLRFYFGGKSSGGEFESPRFF